MSTYDFCARTGRTSDEIFAGVGRENTVPPAELSPVHDDKRPQRTIIRLQDIFASTPRPENYM